MRLGNEAKVGLIVFGAFLALVGIYWFLAGSTFRGSTYPLYALFDNVQKLDKGADVRLAGVKIGAVSAVSLTKDSKARIDMRINNGIRVPADSKARITTGGVIGDSFVEIVPGSSAQALKDGCLIQSMHMVQFDEMMTEANALVQELRVSAKSLNKLFGDKEFIGSIKDTVKELQKSAYKAEALLNSTQGMIQQASPKFAMVFDNLTKATGNAVRITKDIQAAVNEDARPGIRGIMQQANEATKNLNDSIKQAQDLLASFNGTSGKITQALDKVNGTVDQAQQMMTNLNEASAGIKDIATDKQLHEDLRTALRNAVQVSEEAKTLVGGLSRKFTGVVPSVTREQKAAIPDYGVSGDALWNMGTSEPRIDANYTFAGMEKAFYRVGFFDIGNSTKVNLQGGIAFDRWNAFRYGLYASEPGIGYNRRFTPDFQIAADLYNPGDVTMELKGIFNVNESLGFYAGFGNVFGGSNKDVLLGLHYNK